MIIRSQPKEIQSACKRLVSAIRKVHQRSPERFRPPRGVTRNWSKSEFIREALLVSPSTWGNFRGVQLVRDRKLHGRVTYAVLGKLRPSERSHARVGASRASLGREPFPLLL
jgi:hypothetical protein